MKIPKQNSRYLWLQALLLLNFTLSVSATDIEHQDIHVEKNPIITFHSRDNENKFSWYQDRDYIAIKTPEGEIKLEKDITFFKNENDPDAPLQDEYGNQLLVSLEPFEQRHLNEVTGFLETFPGSRVITEQKQQRIWTAPDSRSPLPFMSDYSTSRYIVLGRMIDHEWYVTTKRNFNGACYHGSHNLLTHIDAYFGGSFYNPQYVPFIAFGKSDSRSFNQSLVLVRNSRGVYDTINEGLFWVDKTKSGYLQDDLGNQLVVSTKRFHNKTFIEVANDLQVIPHSLILGPGTREKNFNFTLDQGCYIKEAGYLVFAKLASDSQLNVTTKAMSYGSIKYDECPLLTYTIRANFR